MIENIVEVKDDHAFIVPIGDLHMGDKAFSKDSMKKVKGYIDWVRSTPNAYIFLNGDLLNCATRASKTSPFEQDMDLEAQINQVVDLFEPVKDKIIGAITGNHEERLADFTGYNPTIAICHMLGIKYHKYTAVIKMKVGKKNRGGGKNGAKVSYTCVFSHTNGGGGSIGSKLNRIDKMRHTTVTNADLYCGSHNHALAVGVMTSREYDPYNENIINRKQTLVSCGGYLDWNDSYAERMQLEPTKLGSPRIRLDGIKKDIHASV